MYALLTCINPDTETMSSVRNSFTFCSILLCIYNSFSYLFRSWSLAETVCYHVLAAFLNLGGEVRARPGLTVLGLYFLSILWNESQRCLYCELAMRSSSRYLQMASDVLQLSILKSQTTSEYRTTTESHRIPRVFFLFQRDHSYIIILRYDTDITMIVRQIWRKAWRSPLCADNI